MGGGAFHYRSNQNFGWCLVRADSRVSLGRIFIHIACHRSHHVDPKPHITSLLDELKVGKGRSQGRMKRDGDKEG